MVSEALTQLCPASVCGDRPTAPGEDVAESETRRADGALLRDAVDLWWERVTDADDDPAGDFGEFEEEVGGRQLAILRRVRRRATDPPSSGPFQGAIAGEPERVSQFLEALQPRGRPVAAVIHLVSPHFPWRHLPDGTLYAAPAEEADLPINGGNGGVPWIQDLERQRHLLQAGYTDALVGRILDRVEEVGLYDEARSS